MCRFVCAVVVLASSQVHGDDSKSKERPPIRVALQRIVDDKSLSFNRLLREAGFVVRNRYLGRDWVEVERELQVEHLPVTQAWQKQYLLFRHFRVQDKAINTRGAAYDLEIHFAVAKPDSQMRDAGKVVTADAVARLVIEKPYRDVLAGNLLPQGSGLEKALRSDEIRKVATTHPYVVSVEVSYGLYGDMWREFNPYCFEVCVGLAKKPVKGRGQMLRIVYVESRLDAPETFGGKKQANFEASDTLGDML
jgi:hypothetical protein